MEIKLMQDMFISGIPDKKLQFIAISSLMSHPAQRLKRPMDLAIAILLCILLFPLFVFIAIAIALNSRGPVFFRQQRYGLGFEPFTIIKFRSMRHEAPDPHERYEMSKRDLRITRVGAWIRCTGLDELPQLFNVIGGSMSLVGPRPLVEWESRECLARHGERFRLKPGITGLQQINARNTMDNTRFDWDIEYVRRWSPLLDLVILLKTPFRVLHGDDICYKLDSQKGSPHGSAGVSSSRLLS